MLPGSLGLPHSASLRVGDRHSSHTQPRSAKKQYQISTIGLVTAEQHPVSKRRTASTNGLDRCAPVSRIMPLSGKVFVTVVAEERSSQYGHIACRRDT